MNESARVSEKKFEATKNDRTSQMRKSNNSQYANSSIDRILFLQRTIGNQAVGRLIKSGALQAKLRIEQPDDIYEQEADRVADQVMRMPEPQIVSGSNFHIQRACPKCEENELKQQPIKEEEQLQAKTASSFNHEVDPDIENHIQSMKGRGNPLSERERAFFEPRFGYDFSQVRMHTDTRAAEISQEVNARAFTVGRDVVFGLGEYQPESAKSKRLLGHELTHVVQQGTAPRIQYRSANENGECHVQSSELHIGVANQVVQRWPGDGMKPPGDCSWARYLVLRGSVETAKAVVRMLGACSAGDSCILLATKIAAITAEIAARVAVAATCFRGGDEGHREQVEAKVNMMNRCYRFFTGSNCSPELIAAMAVVVERAREVIAAAAVAVAIALVVVLIAAIIALAEVIAALIAAAAEAAAAAAAVAAVIALLIVIKDELSLEESSGA